MRLLFFCLVACVLTAGAALAPGWPPGTHRRGSYTGAFRALRAGRADRPREQDGWPPPWLIGLAALAVAGAAGVCWWAFRRRRARPAGRPRVHDVDTVEIVTADPERPPTLGAPERRAAPRLPCRLRGYAYFLNESRPVEVRDVTAAGIRLWCDQPFRAGAWLALSLPAVAPDLPQPLRARVEHATACPAGGWLVGCSFLEDLSAEQLRGLLDVGGAG